MWSRQPFLDTLCDLLAAGRQAEVLKRLEEGVLDAASSSSELNLQLASLCTLYAERGLEPARLYLSQVQSADARALQRPLFIALNAELAALRGLLASPLKDALDVAAQANDNLTLYHAAHALLLAGDVKRSRDAALQISLERLPKHLQWRSWSLRAELAERMGEGTNALKAYRLALKHAPETDKPLIRFALAESWLQLNRPDEALAVLGDDVPSTLEPAERVRGHYLIGVAQRQSGDAARALPQLRLAEALAAELGEHPPELLQELARSQAASGQLDAALASYRTALAHTEDARRPYLQHEFTRLLRDLGQLDEAETVLRDLLSQARYPHRAEASAELAEVSYFLGKFARVKPLAEYAIKGGVVGPACLALGRVALEYFHLEEAEAWLEQASGASSQGEPLWLSAQLLLAETFAHKLDAQPERLKQYAERALVHLSPQDPWTVTLERYIEQADEVLASQKKIVN